jgi:4-hydroxy-tetrahydrodipicolinate reductase
MSTITILGEGPLGHAVADALGARGDVVAVHGRPRSGRHDAGAIRGSDVVVDASRGDAVLSNVTVALAAGVRRIAVATTGWEQDRERVASRAERLGATVVAAPNLALGAAIFLRLVSDAAHLAAAIGGFEPSVVEWHRRAKVDRPSGTARDIVRRLSDASLSIDPDEIAVVRSGAMPGQHTVALDGPSETIELRLTARDRRGYAAGAIAAIDWLVADTGRPAGIVPFDVVVDDLIARHSRPIPAPTASAA